jgi:hypothetical protein
MRNMGNGEITPAAPAEAVAPAAGKGRLALARNIAIWVGLGLAGFLLNEGLTWARDRMMDKPDYLQQLAEAQQKEFDEVKASLRQIGGSIDSGDRAAYDQVRDAVASMEKTNASLIQQLVLAKQENETLRKVGSAKTGISGGYDFLLAQGSGLRLEDGTVFGLENVGGGGVRVNVSSPTDSTNRFLRSGQAVDYTSNSGGACRVSLLSFNDARIGTASFARSCG